MSKIEECQSFVSVYDAEAEGYRIFSFWAIDPLDDDDYSFEYLVKYVLDVQCWLQTKIDSGMSVLTYRIAFAKDSIRLSFPQKRYPEVYEELMVALKPKLHPTDVEEYLKIWQDELTCVEIPARTVYLETRIDAFLSAHGLSSVWYRFEPMTEWPDDFPVWMSDHVLVDFDRTKVLTAKIWFLNKDLALMCKAACTGA